MSVRRNDREAMIEYVTVLLGGQLFGLPIARVQDVFMPERLTRVPRAPAFIEGVINVRGRVVPVIDQRRRFGERSMAPDEFGSISRAALLRAGHVHKSDPRLEIRRPRIARQQHARFEIQGGDDERRRSIILISKHPIQVVSDRQLARFVGNVIDFQPRDLDRILERHELRQAQCDAVRGVSGSRIAETMPHHVNGRALANRQRGGAPKISGIFIADVDRLSGRIADRIIAPWRELVLLRVQRPRAARAIGGDQKAELRIGDDVDPRRRSPLAVIEHDDILARS